MIDRFRDKKNHPMYGKQHTSATKLLISKLGILNPMYGKQHTDQSKIKMSVARSHYIVHLFDIHNVLLNTFNNNVELAAYLNIHKSTVGRYIKSGKLYNNKLFFKKEKK
jgi:group I intron endonuclease